MLNKHDPLTSYKNHMAAAVFGRFMVIWNPTKSLWRFLKKKGN